MSEKKSTTLDDNRIIYMQGSFNEDKAEKIVTSLLEMDAKDPTKDVVLYIDSYGGHVHSLLAIHDVIKNLLHCNVATVCIGKAMSCGQMLLISGAKGKRFILPNARVLIHEVSSGHWGKLKELENGLEETKALQVILSKLILKYTNIKKEGLKALLQKDSYISANEAKRLGLVDHIVSSPRALYGKIKQ